jgi:hypothetical protein
MDIYISSQRQGIPIWIMPPRTPEKAQQPASASDVFALVQHLTSQLHESRMKEIVEVAKDFDLKDSQLIVDLLGTVRPGISSSEYPKHLLW